jgi:hypothetical protein
MAEEVRSQNNFLVGEREADGLHLRSRGQMVEATLQRGGRVHTGGWCQTDQIQHHPVSEIGADGTDAGAALLSESWCGATMTERVCRRSCRVQAHLTTFREHRSMTVVRESQPPIHGKEVMFPIHSWFGLNTTVPDVLGHHRRIPRLRPDAELPSIANPRVC